MSFEGIVPGVIESILEKIEWIKNHLLLPQIIKFQQF